MRHILSTLVIAGIQTGEFREDPGPGRHGPRLFPYRDRDLPHRDPGSARRRNPLRFRGRLVVEGMRK
ncbi:MAG: hypothetical protein MZV64_09775 [Ignavibacteriales bacterium]|nr:hypothetical protein [Ignavibacteriales bacterium]